MTDVLWLVFAILSVIVGYYLLGKSSVAQESITVYSVEEFLAEKHGPLEDIDGKAIVAAVLMVVGGSYALCKITEFLVYLDVI